MVMVLENSPSFIAVGTTILFLLLGTISGLLMNRKLGQRGESSVTKIRNRPFTSSSELRLSIQSLEFEKSLTAEALTRAFEAMNQGKIDPREYDRLNVQYNEKLQTYEKKIAEMRSTLDYTDIQDLRKDLDYFLHDKIKQLDEKLLQLSKKKEERLEFSSVSSKDTISERNAKNKGQTRKPSLFFTRHSEAVSEQEKKIQETQEEIIAALKRLESEEKGSPNGQPTNMEKKDALANLEGHH